MTVEQNAPRIDADELASFARSILACPAEVQLVVDGIDDITVGLTDGTGLTMEDDGGRPVFSCPTDSVLAAAGRERRSALLTIASGVGARDDRTRSAGLTLAGRLETTAEEACACCSEVRAIVTAHLNFVLLVDGPIGAGDAARQSQQHRVPLNAFLSNDHVLNPGYLQRSSEHANACHQDELRRTVATTADTRLADVVGVSLDDLTPAGVTLTWVDTSGAHRRRVDFGRRATDPHDLGELLRSRLHAGLC